MGNIFGHNMKLIWTTDPHFDLSNPELFGRTVREMHSPDLVVISGDTSEYSSFSEHIYEFHRSVGCHVAFVAGNHDRWGSSFAESSALFRKYRDQIVYLSTSQPIVLSADTCLVGQDGWYDTRFGDAYSSNIGLRDWTRICDFAECDGVIKKCKQIAGKQALLAKAKLEAAACTYRKIFFVTHVPPFEESADSDKNYLPWYSSKIMGEAILGVAKSHPSVSFEVLCGHTHRWAEHKAASNVLVRTGDAEYHCPKVNGVFEV